MSLFLKKLFILTFVVSFLVLGGGFAASAADVFPEKTVKSFEKGEKSQYLAGFHKKQELNCDSCHDSAIIDDSEKSINAACIECHGDLASMAAKSKGEINPHRSHLGTINCTACHSGHEQSVTYCFNCHVFDNMNISFNNGAKPKSQREDISKYENAKPVKIENVDILVIGSGATGSMAAIAAAEKGVKAVIVEKMPIAGGNSQLAAGGMNAANSIYQQKKGIKDNADLMFLDTMKGGKYINNPLLVRDLAAKSADAIQWLADRGAYLDNPAIGGGASAARMHGPSGGAFAGPYLRAFFVKELDKYGIETRVNTKAVKLITDKNGKVTGALVKGKHTGIYQINAKAVVLATGGFGANAPFVAKFRPELLNTATSNQPGTQGDGMFMGQAIGADSVDVKEIQVNPTLLVGSPVIVSETVRGQGAIFVNRDGVRFMSELLTRDVTSAAIFKQKGASIFMVFDQNLKDKVKQIHAAFELEKAYEGDTPAELAKKIGVDPATFEETLKKYNSYVDAQKDPEFNRASLPVKIEKSKFYAIEVKPAIHYTMGGLKMDTSARIISVKGAPIAGLYGAGEVTGGVHGANRLGGNSIAETIVFGKIAGENAADYIKTGK